MLWACAVKRRHWLREKCMEHEVEGSRPKGRPEDMERGCAKRLPSTQLEREDARGRQWKKLIKIAWWSGWWLGECFFWYQLTLVVWTKGHKMVVVVCVFTRNMATYILVLVNCWELRGRNLIQKLVYWLKSTFKKEALFPSRSLAGCCDRWH